jgi:hypothetical protein
LWVSLWSDREAGPVELRRVVEPVGGATCGLWLTFSDTRT